jgi:ribonuclease BN (tRNA processing enzyme)
MELTFYGVRGTCPIARPDQVRYGGNTTCLHFRTRSGQDLILDAGSGLRPLAREMMQREFGRGLGEAHILIGHTHWDHILGFPFFYPFFVQGNRFVVVSAGQTGVHIRDILASQHSEINWPVTLEDLAADPEYLSFRVGDDLALGEYRVETVQLNHPGITVGYRVEADGGAVAVYTDTARVRQIWLGDGVGPREPDEGFTREYLARLAHNARGVDVLVHDTYFLEHEIAGRYHWGHSTVEDALEVARMAGVKQLVLFHHHQDHSDRVVDEKLALARDLSQDEPFQVEAAAEGWCLRLGTSSKDASSEDASSEDASSEDASSEGEQEAGT